MRAVSIIVCVNQKIREPCILITNHTRAILKTKAFEKKSSQRIAHTLKEAATPQQHQTIIPKKKPPQKTPLHIIVNADVNISVFF